MEPYAPYPLDLVRDWLRRRRWWVRLAAALVVVGWGGYWAQDLMRVPEDSPPWAVAGVNPWTMAIPYAVYAYPIDPAEDRTEDLLAAFGDLPTGWAINWPAPAPSGMQWEAAWEDPERWNPPTSGGSATPSGAIPFDVSVALEGDWRPAERLHQGKAVEYLEHPETVAAMARIAELSGEPFSFALLATAPGAIPAYTPVRQAARLFTARARYHAEQGDFAAAGEDIETVLKLTAGVEREGPLISLLVGNACRALALSEVGCWSVDRPMPAEQARDLMRRIDRYPFHAADVWERTVRGELWQARDAMYPRTRSGREICLLYLPDPTRRGDLTLRTLNLLSPLFGPAERERRMFEEVAEALIAESRQSLIPQPGGYLAEGDQHVRLRPCFPAFGFMGLSLPSIGRCLVLTGRDQAEQSGTLAGLALAAYHHDHGEYPASLDELVPDYLEALPPDPFSQGPLVYRRGEADEYVLYTVGEDGIDDGGDFTTDDGKGGYRSTPDRRLNRPRRKGWGDEWYLVESEK